MGNTNGMVQFGARVVIALLIVNSAVVIADAQHRERRLDCLGSGFNLGCTKRGSPRRTRVPLNTIGRVSSSCSETRTAFSRRS